MSSLTHFSSSNHLPETLWYHPYPFIMDSSPKIHHNNQQQEEDTTTTKQPMFEKPLTPSDVGKLNRLVIPKQHAEKYFPLAGATTATAGDPSEKGLLLSFEDETGKQWRFRYSYWNSSQSYVLTKGWSRFVKEKRLDAGDVVLFERHSYDCDRLFIGWRRRPAAVVQPMLDSHPTIAAFSDGGAGGGQINGWPTTTRVGFYESHYNYPSHHHLPLSLPHPYQPDCLHAGGINDNVEKQQRDMVAASGNPRRVRLFGVNLECPEESEPSTPDGSSHLGQGQGQDQGQGQGGAGQPYYQYHNNLNLNLNQDMNINFSQMSYQQHQG